MKQVIAVLVIISLLFVLLALWFYPSTSELLHVFRSENRSSEYLRVYEKLDLVPSRGLKISLARDLMAMNDRRGLLFALDLLKEKHDPSLLEECLLFASGHGEKEAHLELLETAYLATEDLQYLYQKIDLYSFFGMKDQHMETQKRIALIEPDTALLKQIYFGGEKEFVKELLESRIHRLSIPEKLQLYQYYSWDNQLEKAFDLAVEYIPFKNMEPGMLRDLKDLALYFSDPEKALMIQEYRVQKTGLPEDLRVLAGLYDYMGEIQSSMDIYRRLFEKTADISELRRIAQTQFDNGYLEEYAETLSEILSYGFEKRLFEEIFYTLIDSAGMVKAAEFLNLSTMFAKKESWFDSPLDEEVYRDIQSNFLLQVLWAQGKTEEAVRELLKRDPTKLSSDWLSLIFRVEAHKSQQAFAIEYFKKSNDPEGLRRLWDIALKEGNMEEGRQSILSLLDLGKPKDITMYLLALPEDFLAKELDLLASREANRDVLYTVMNEAMKHGLYQLAKKSALELIQREPKNGEALLILSKLHLWEDEFEKARHYFSLYTEIDPNHGLARFQLGLGALEKQKPKEALEHFRVALNGLKEPEYAFHRAYATWKVEGAKAAVGMFRKLYQDMKDPYILHSFLAILDEAGEDEEFERMIADLGDENRKDPEILQLVGSFQSRRKQYEKAAETFSELSETVSEKDALQRFQALTQKGYQEELAGNQKAAVESYAKALQIKDDPTIRSSKEWLESFTKKQMAMEYTNQDGISKLQYSWMIPKSRYKIGGYLRDTEGRQDAQVSLEEIKEARYTAAIGSGTHHLSWNGKVEAEWGRNQYMETADAVEEDMHRSYLSIARNFHLRPNLNLRGELSRIGYRTTAGKIAGYQNSEISLRLDLPSKRASYTAGYSHLDLKKNHPGKSNVGFSDYKALTILKEWAASRNRNQRIEYSAGLTWDFQNLSPVIRSSLETREGIQVGGQWTYDPFLKGGVAQWALKYKKRY